MPKFIDIHSHLSFADYGKDLEEVIKRMEESGVATIAVGADLNSSKEAVKVAEKNKNIWACIGIHPTEKESFEELDFVELVENNKVVAIGECGLDYNANQNSNIKNQNGISDEEKERQKEEFIKQIDFAIKYNKPLMLHVRDGAVSGGAYQDAFNILESYLMNHKSAPRGNMHFFDSNLSWAEKFIGLGFTISFTGVITYQSKANPRPNDLVRQEVIKNIPLNKIHAETDAPYVAPVPYRGKRNEPTYVIEVVKKIAEIRGEDLETVRLQLLNNAQKVFGISI